MAPLASSGIEKLECDNLKLQCFQSRTGVKFVLTAEPGTPDLDNVLHGIYELYADYVLKVCISKKRRGVQGLYIYIHIHIPHALP